MECDCNQGTSWRRQTCPTRRMTARKTPGANATREAWILVLLGGQFLPKQGVRHELGLNRNFRINSHIFGRYGPTMGYKGCDNKMTGDDARPRSSEWRVTLEELMGGDDVEAEIIARSVE